MLAVKNYLISSADKEHICEVCSKGFGKKSALQSHLLTHKGEKPHSCEVCSKRFSQKSSLQEHLLTHTGEKPHCCDVCYTGFRHKSDLQRHLLTHTGDKPHGQGHPAGPSQEAPVNASSTSSYGNIEEKANKLLKEKDYFKKGVPITDNEINEAIKLLNKNENVLNTTPYYKEFLNKYGSIYGLEFYMCGPIVDCYKGCRVQNMVAKNNTFGDVCTDFKISEEQLKYYWLIGHDENIFYYIDSSDIGKGRIYSIDSYSGRTKLFAKDFLKFLDKMFNFCKKDSSDES